MKRLIVLACLVMSGMALLTLTASHASAQYPPPEADDVVLAASDVAPAVGGTVSVAAAVTDAGGDPVAGAECTFAVGSQPGSDASVEAGPVTTNSDGVATTLLHVGSTEGTIIVEATCGELTALITVVAGAAVEPEEPAAPPASLPDSGYGPGEASGGPNPFFWAAMALIVGAGSGVYCLTRVRR